MPPPTPPPDPTPERAGPINSKKRVIQSVAMNLILNKKSKNDAFQASDSSATPLNDSILAELIGPSPAGEGLGVGLHFIH